MKETLRKYLEIAHLAGQKGTPLAWMEDLAEDLEKDLNSPTKGK